jgi:hypothetical protein
MWVITERSFFWNVRSCNLLKVTEYFWKSSSENSADIQGQSVFISQNMELFKYLIAYAYLN